MNLFCQNLTRRQEAARVSLEATDRFVSVRNAPDNSLDLFAGYPPSTGEIVAQIVFGGCGHYDDACRRMGGARWPVLWVQGDVCSGRCLTGVQTYIRCGSPVSRILVDGRVAGSAWQDADADYCLLAGVLPEDVGRSGGEQTTSCFSRMEEALGRAGMSFSDVARTWLYLDRLLDWYDEFNSARTAFFVKHGVFDRLVPASTGIGGSNPAGAALVAGALAIRPRHAGVRVSEVISPLQCPATEYRSSFSRAVEIAFPQRRTLLVSGTASIAPGGESAHRDDVAKQIDLTLDVVEAILNSREMSWSDTTRAVGYFRNLQDLPAFDACCRNRGIAPLPLVPAHAAVCRDDLLFEIELDAIAVDRG